MDQVSTGFPYHSLSKDSIRLVRLLHRDRVGFICCEIHQWNLPTSTVRGGDDFVALSYCWGDPTLKNTIMLNNTPFAVTKNLHDALESLLESHQDRTNGYYWIDALCINQRDIEERNEQVYRMWHIYASAKMVFVWLGPEDEDTADAFYLLSKFLPLPPSLRSSPLPWSIQCRKQNNEIQNTTDKAVQRQPESSNSSDSGEWLDLEPLLSDFLSDSRVSYAGPSYNVLFWQHQDSVAAVIRLCNRAYFKRAWVVLEVSQAQSLELLCGRHRCSMQQFEDLLDRTELREHNASTRDARELFQARSEIVLLTEDSALFFTGILQTFVRKGCSDPRDRIYACLGDRRLKSLQEILSFTPVTPDYTRNTFALAIEVISCFDQLHEAFVRQLRQEGRPTRAGHLHELSKDTFFRALSDALHLPNTPALFYTSVESHMRWTTGDDGRETLIAYGRQVASLGETTRWFLHPEHYHDRADIEYVMGTM